MSDEFEKLLSRHGFLEPRCHSGVGPGWFPILDRLLPKLKELGVIDLSQVKEKLGELRVYASSSVDGKAHEVRSAISKAEVESRKTCETCGEPGTIRHRGWSKVRCDSCQVSWETRRRDEMGEVRWAEEQAEYDQREIEDEE